MKYKIGQGIDVHQLVTGPPLIIGGVSIPYSKGSKGHSDGDVLYHSIVDAILGALALGDIGQHFPSGDERWKDAPSKKFLEHAQYLMQEKGYATVNIDATVVLQEPQLLSYISAMRQNIARVLSIAVDSVSVKATTSDHMGLTGTGAALAATALVLLIETNGN